MVGGERNRKKRILLLMREYVLGGAETQFRFLIEYAQQHGWNLDVLIEHDLHGDDASVREAQRRLTDVAFYELAGGRVDGRMFVGVMRHILRHLFRGRYDACLIYYPLDLMFVPFIRASGIPVIYSERVDAQAIADSPYLQWCLRCCSKILANSRCAKKELEALTKRHVTWIRNGQAAVPQLPLKTDRRIRRILVPARIAPPKNQLLPLQYLRRCPDTERKIVFAGLVEDKAYHGRLRQFVRKNGLQDKVEFLGQTADMAQEYRKADLVLLPSFAEGTPNVVLEAYLYGRPVIVSDINVERDIVPDPRLRFGVNDALGIGECIRYVQEMPEAAYSHMIAKNRRIVLKNYGIEQMAERFYAVLSG